jgi:ABC-type thiamin/hydroxymethylpyrimidine transport system permease subunit
METETRKDDQDIKSLEKSLEDDYKPTFFLKSKVKNIILLDLLYSVIIGVMGGIISSLIPFSLLIKVWYPLTGGTQLVSGHHVIWAAIVYGLTKKKPTILLTMITKGILEFLLADPWGVLIILVDFMEGCFLVLGFLIVESVGEGNSKLGWGIAGGFGNFFQAPFFWVLNQRFYLNWSLWVLAFIFAFISGVLITGLLGRTVKNYLIKAGVPTTAYPEEVKKVNG